VQESQRTPKTGKRQRETDQPISAIRAKHLSSGVIRHHEDRRRHSDLFTPNEQFDTNGILVLFERVAIPDFNSVA
jgi:hypothetical protein